MVIDADASESRGFLFSGHTPVGRTLSAAWRKHRWAHRLHQQGMAAPFECSCGVR